MSISNADQTPQLTPDEIAEQASKPDHDQIYRQPLRGDETKGDPDERDVAGGTDHEDTPHGSEERKHQVEREAEKNDRQ
ncbi:MAG: hypothetical protein ABIR33_03650 [Pyrinomonadaceae bacterium]